MNNDDEIALRWRGWDGYDIGDDDEEWKYFITWEPQYMRSYTDWTLVFENNTSSWLNEKEPGLSIKVVFGSGDKKVVRLLYDRTDR